MNILLLLSSQELGHVITSTREAGEYAQLKRRGREEGLFQLLKGRGRAEMGSDEQLASTSLSLCVVNFLLC